MDRQYWKDDRTMSTNEWLLTSDFWQFLEPWHGRWYEYEIFVASCTDNIYDLKNERWLLRDMINHVRIYGSRVAEGCQHSASVLFITSRHKLAIMRQWQLVSAMYVTRLLAATKHLYEWYCLSVTPFWLCSHHCIIMEFSGVITKDHGNVHAKGQGQRSKVKVTTQLSRFRTVIPVWIHIWWWNDTYSLMLLRRGALLFL